VSQSPTASASSSQVLEYDKAWAALNLMIREGRGFSGHERKCCFLNLGPKDDRFANISSATGLDFDDDGRGLALCDWDWDGDLDLWLTNRTGPGVRFIRNDTPSGNPAIAFHLEGTTANREAIGARVELYLGDQGTTKRIQTLHAGHGHLSQSSKWVHFGLGDRLRPHHVIVRWPGGRAETFRLPGSDGTNGTNGTDGNNGTSGAKGGRFRLVQGSGQSLPAKHRPPAKVLLPTQPKVPAESDAGRIVVLQPAPVPELEYRDLEGATRRLAPISAQPQTPILLNLWATWCAPCLAEMSEWTAHKAPLAATGLRIVSISVDDEASRPKIPAFLKKLDYPFESGTPHDTLIERLETLQRSFIGRQSPLPVPSSFLVDRRGRIAVIYRGPVSATQLLADVKLLEAPLDTILAGAIPFSGRWIGSPKPTEARSVAIKFLNRGSIAESEKYLRHLFAYRRVHPAAFTDPEMGDLQNYLGAVLYDQKRYAEALEQWNDYIRHVPGNRGTLVDMARAWTALKNPGKAADALRQALRLKRDDPELLNQLARSLLETGEAAEAIGLYRESLVLEPNRVIRFELAQTLVTTGRLSEAIAELKTLLAAERNWPPAANNLAWLLATSEDPALRDGAEAVRLAEIALIPTISSTLGTLSAAYAEVGRFDDALRTINEAIASDEQKGESQSLADLRIMKAAYEAKKPYRDPKLGKESTR
jgi:tetratricopeptide (TPR) repeat protein/peroxiredoxin